MRRPLLLRALGPLGCFAVLSIVGIMATLLIFLLYKGAAALNLALFFGDTPPLQAVLGLRPVWEGLWPACAGTLGLVGLTLLLSIVPGVGCGLFLVCYASPRQRQYLDMVVDILAGMPSVVMGLFGFSLILFLRHSLMPDANTCLLLAAGCLALLVLPVLVVATREALQAVPEDLRLAATALGIHKGAYARHILLPAASRGIWGGIVLALGRAAEDTAVILLTGVVANAGLPAGLGEKFEALPFAIYYTAAQYQNQDELSRGFGAALVLLALSGVLLLAARCMEASYVRHWHGKRQKYA